MLKPGDTFERYTIDALLGQGGMGTVYSAHDTRLERRVAVKIIREGGAGSDVAAARLLREARAAAALNHPNAVSIFDVGEIQGSPYIVMELVAGRTLREAIQDGSTPIAVRLAWLADVARALASAHRTGLVHRDIKPENVMVRDDGVVKVLDFGIARSARSASGTEAQARGGALSTLTKEGVKIGTPLYMAPEQIRSDQLDGRADQFAWGVLAFELLTGSPPWRGAGDPLAAAASILTDEPEEGALLRAGVPAELRTVVLRALAKRPNDRFASMDDVVCALEGAAKGEAATGGDARLSLPAGDPPAPPPAPASATLLQKYSTDDVREVLARAVERQERSGQDTRLGFDDLLSAAREVGVDEETLREASRELRERGVTPASNADFEVWRRRKRRRFYRHLWIYVVCTIPFIAIAIAERTMAPLMPALWWAVGLGIHAMSAFTAHEDDHREELEKRARKERTRRRREAAAERELDDRASLLLRTGASLRRRIDASAPPARARIAGGESTAEAHAAAEAEVEAAAEQGADGRRRAR